MEETVTAAKLFQSPEIGQTSYLQFGSLFFRNHKQNHEQVEKAILTLTQNQKCKTLKTDKYVKIKTKWKGDIQNPLTFTPTNLKMRTTLEDVYFSLPSMVIS